MANKEPLYIDMVAGSELMDTQGEVLSVEGADISALENGQGRLNDNHGKGFFNSVGRVVEAKKIFGPQDCDDERHQYYWEKIKAPYIYVKGYLYDDEDHPNARAAAAILRNIHKSDCPLQLKASVEGGVVQRGMKNPRLLQRTKIHSVALTFTPANQNTLVEPLMVQKSLSSASDDALIKSVMHLATEDVPSFRSITRQASADKIQRNIEKIRSIAQQLGYDVSLPEFSSRALAKSAVELKIVNSVHRINKLVKMLSAGYGGASTPTSRVHGAVIQTEAIDGAGKFTYITCAKCGKEQVYFNNQVKCQQCGQSFPFADVLKAILASKT